MKLAQGSSLHCPRRGSPMAEKGRVETSSTRRRFYRSCERAGIAAGDLRRATPACRAGAAPNCFSNSSLNGLTRSPTGPRIGIGIGAGSPYPPPPVYPPPARTRIPDTELYKVPVSQISGIGWLSIRMQLAGSAPHNGAATTLKGHCPVTVKTAVPHDWCTLQMSAIAFWVVGSSHSCIGDGQVRICTGRKRMGDYPARNAPSRDMEIAANSV